MALRAPKQNDAKNQDHFLIPTSPQNGVEHVCFVRLALLGGFWANFEKSHIFDRFWGVFPLARPEN